MIIKSLPETERPLEKAVRTGITSLSNAELLGLIIHTGTRSKSAIDLAEEVLARCDRGIRDLGEISLEELTEIAGIGQAKACTVLAAVELGKRMATSVDWEAAVLRNAEDVAALFMEKLRYEKKEYFQSVILNARGQVISIDDVSVGELSRTIVHPREVFRKAVAKSGAGIIFVHNHPSGDPEPSDDDIATTRRLAESGKLLGIQVIDHVIIGDGTYRSLKTMDLI